MNVTQYDFRTALDGLKKSKPIIITTYLMMLSYFYNLPVMNYSARGSNDLWLYDFAGLGILYLYVQHFTLVNKLIDNNKALNSLFHFLMWGNIMLVPTIIDSIINDKIFWALQSLKYMYHFWIFFLTTIFLIIIIQDLKQLKRIVNYCLLFGSVAFLIIIMQNFGVIPYLWSNVYSDNYQGFLSGTLGPNKIVAGMTSLMVFALCMGLLNDKKILINKALILITLCLSLLALIMSGSRTSYLGLLVFVVYFFIRETVSFIYSGTILVILVVIISSINPEIITKATDVYEARVENKIKKPKSITDTNVDEVYEDLGSGRKELSVIYINYLLDNPFIIPFGLGFNNRLSLSSSAHNTYLSLINEVGLVGVFFYFRWLFAYLSLKMPRFPQMRMALKGIVLSMLVTLAFGEHLYVYRPLFGLVGLFLLITTLLLSPTLILAEEKK